MPAFASTSTSTSSSTLPPSNLVSSPPSPDLPFYPGLANTNASLCFLNAVLQALASLSDLSRYLARLRLRLGLHHSLPSSSSVIVALSDTLAELNVPRPRPTILRPTSVVEALVAGQPACSRLFDSCQQDAHELLVMVIEAIDHELAQLDAPPQTGLGGLVAAEPPRAPLATSHERSPFRGLMANRVACAACGFSAGIHHLPTDHLSFNLPTRASCTLEDCLEEFTHLEILEQYTCRKCTLVHADRSLRAELPKARSKRTRQALKQALSQVGAALGEEPERVLAPTVEQALEPVWSQMTTKQTMFARPPDVLTIHVSRSTVFGSGQLLKNHCRLIFNEILILDRFTTSPSLCARAEAPISRAPSSPLVYLYRLLSVIVHQGTHLSGHYLTFRRAPTGSWWRVSDEEVERCEVKEVLESNPTLLIYQRMGNEDRVN